MPVFQRSPSKDLVDILTILIFTHTFILRALYTAKHISKTAEKQSGSSQKQADFSTISEEVLTATCTPCTVLFCCMLFYSITTTVNLTL